MHSIYDPRADRIVEGALQDLVRSIVQTLPPEEAKGISAIDPNGDAHSSDGARTTCPRCSTIISRSRACTPSASRCSNGQTAKDVLIEQLNVIEAKLKETSLASTRARRPTVCSSNARFLQERFQRSEFDKVPVVDLGFDTHEDTWRPR